MSRENNSQLNMPLVTELLENGRDPYPAHAHWCRTPNAQKTRLRQSCPLRSVWSHAPKRSPSKDTWLNPQARVTACKTIASLVLLPSVPSIGGTQNQGSQTTIRNANCVRHQPYFPSTPSDGVEWPRTTPQCFPHFENEKNTIGRRLH